MLTLKLTLTLTLNNALLYIMLTYALTKTLTRKMHTLIFLILIISKTNIFMLNAVHFLTWGYPRSTKYKEDEYTLHADGTPCQIPGKSIQNRLLYTLNREKSRLNLLNNAKQIHFFGIKKYWQFKRTFL